MVTLSLASENTCRKWLFFLTLSLCINGAVASSIHLGNDTERLPFHEPLKVHFKAVSAPASVPTVAAQQSTKTMSQKVVTSVGAKQVVAVDSVDPILKPVQKPVEKTEVREVLQASSQSETASSDYQGNDIATVLSDAKYRYRVPPVYPKRALELGQQGLVTLHAHINQDGYPEHLKIASSSGYSQLDKAALSAVKKWEFEPVTENGFAVASWVKVPVQFMIQSN